MSFPLETVCLARDRNALTGKILDFLNTPTAVDPVTENVPEIFKVWPNFPNPFNASTRIQFEVSRSTNVTLQIFDVRGRKIFESRGTFNPGIHSFVWHGTDRSGQNVASGMYLYHLIARKGENRWTRQGRMLLVK